MIKKNIYVLVLGFFANAWGHLHISHEDMLREHSRSILEYYAHSDEFQEMEYRMESHPLNNISALVVAFGAGYIANIAKDKDSKFNRIANRVALTVLFGIPVIMLAGIFLNNTVYYRGYFDKDDYSYLRYELPLHMWRLGCYYLGYLAASGQQDLKEEKTDAAQDKYSFKGIKAFN